MKNRTATSGFAPTGKRASVSGGAVTAATQVSMQICERMTVYAMKKRDSDARPLSAAEERRPARRTWFELALRYASCATGPFCMYTVQVHEPGDLFEAQSVPSCAQLPPQDHKKQESGETDLRGKSPQPCPAAAAGCSAAPASFPVVALQPFRPVAASCCSRSRAAAARRPGPLPEFLQTGSVRFWTHGGSCSWSEPTGAA